MNTIDQYRMDRLSPKRQRFVAEILIDGNATAAARRAGYSERSSNMEGPRLLGNPAVKAAIERARAERSERTCIRADAVLRELAELALSPISEALPASVKVRAVEVAMKHLGIAGSDKVEVGVTDRLAERLAAARARLKAADEHP